MTPAALKHRLLRLLEVENPGTAPVYVQDDVRDSVNKALQTLWTAPKQASRIHYTKREDSVSFPAGTNAAVMAEDIQGVIPPVRVRGTNRLLTPCDFLSELLSYPTLQGGLAGNDEEYGTPEVYFLDRAAQGGTDATKITLYVAPSPSNTITVDIDVEKQAPRFETADFCSGSPPSLGMPHNYVESLLLPVAAYYASDSHWFNKPDHLPKLEADYKMALSSVGVTDPQLLNVRTRKEKKEADV